MILFLAHLVLTAGLLLVVANIVEGIKVDSWGAALLGALVSGLANAVTKGGGLWFRDYRQHYFVIAQSGNCYGLGAGGASRMNQCRGANRCDGRPL
jgi:hypothetical protein